MRACAHRYLSPQARTRLLAGKFGLAIRLNRPRETRISRKTTGPVPSPPFPRGGGVFFVYYYNVHTYK